LAFPNPVAVAFDHRHLGVMQQAIQQCGDAGSIGKDLIPLFEWTVGGDDYAFAFVATVDDLVE